MHTLESYRERIRTDLACERRRANLDIPGVTYHEYQMGFLDYTHLEIKTEEGANQIGKPIGIYQTWGFPELFRLTADEYKDAVTHIVTSISSLLPNETTAPLLVVGLGNSALTADAIGPRATQQMEASVLERPNGICILTPGVTAQSGMEAARIIAAVAKEIRARAVLAIDALCARSTARLMRTIQIANTGITPGSGIRESHNAINADTIGVPVIAVGIPTLVSTAAVVCDVLEKAGGEDLPDAFRLLIDEERLYVCPKDIDIGIERACSLLADAVNLL